MSAYLGEGVLGSLILGVISDPVIITPVYNVDASQSLTFSELALLDGLELEFSDSLTLSNTLDVDFIALRSPSSDSLELEHLAVVETTRPFTGYGCLANIDAVLGRTFMLGKSKVFETPYKGIDTLTFTETSDVAFNTLQVGVADTLNLADVAATNFKFIDVSQVVLFTDLPDGDKEKPVGETLTLTETSVVVKVITSSVVDALSLADTSIPQLVRDQIRFYSPDTSRSEFSLPSLTRRNSITLESQGLVLELKNPAPDNIFRTVSQRVSRESFGGETIVYRSPSWVGQESLLIDIANIHLDKYNEVLDFMTTSLGHFCLLTDWESRVWGGVIMNPENFLVFSKKGHFDIAIEFLGSLE
jgi:hypothetical protein